ncbi:Xaa-Pro aminopeptidase (plasmid) [Legionella adelaidensis]|uniref:Xaa-Pro aminopeptidase n=1 Tax=Legionella adelaidensis TaxID=45056 RepID=A0A0W0R1E3_9GAMM|nr:Xaa-Pro aminopeptidase [Legionella adelaidensis]KTC64777.1 Xaa-Pro aminopeptidase [Legionella adelaidensis]VEH81914.1 Xaa-Pro aminopeptidase [Legionella adelaidensis]
MITQKEYVERRKKLASKLPPDSLAIIPAASEVTRSGDTTYRFRQDSDFYYLTGFNEPDALLILTSGNNCKAYLFNLAKDPVQELWTGIRLGQEQALKELGVNEAFSLNEIEKKLPEIVQDKKAIFYPIGRYQAWEKKIFAAWQEVKMQSRKGIAAPDSFMDLQPILGEMRLFKSESEIALMQKAADISVEGHLRAMQKAKVAQFEYELEAELIYRFTQGGCRSVAYDPIVAAGANACILHYTQNDKALRDGELVLIDAGGEYAGYAADITRTFPKNGKFSSEQKAVYDLVLQAQRAGIEKVRPGVLWDEIQKIIVEVLTTGLLELGILKPNSLEKEEYKQFYMHNSGHWLGLDVHDVGSYKINRQWRPLEEGMVLTVEPGLYIKEDALNVPEAFRGIGVRIEDDIVVTSTGNKNLTGKLAVESSEIEAIVRGA